MGRQQSRHAKSSHRVFFSSSLWYDITSFSAKSQRSPCSQPNTPPDTLIETLMTLSILITRFPGLLASVDAQPPPLTVLAPLLSHSRPAVRKRAIGTLAQFVPVTPPALFQELLSQDVLPGIASGASERQQTMVQLVAAVARHSALRIAPVLNEIVPGILKAAKKDEEELRESCLQTLEALVLRCPAEVTPYLSPMIQTASNYIKYDPVSAHTCFYGNSAHSFRTELCR